MMVKPVRGDEKCSNKECKTNEGKTSERGAFGRGKKKTADTSEEEFSEKLESDTEQV